VDALKILRIIHALRNPVFHSREQFSAVFIFSVFARDEYLRNIVISAIFQNCADHFFCHIHICDRDYFFIFGDNTFYIAPAFLITGLITGIALGAFCQAFAGKSVWRSALTGNNE
jgi:hypothetical protein